MRKLAGKVAIITGSSYGIGRATAKLFAAEGAGVVLAGRTQAALEQVAEEVVAAGGTCIAVPTDICDSRQVAHLVNATLEEFDRIDVLVNNAGTLPDPVPLAEMDDADWDYTFDVNTKGVFRTVKCVWPVMVRQGGGTIVNTASVIAFRGVAEMAAYCASKAGVVMLTKVLALEGAPHGIRVNCVCPGFIDTPMNERLGAVQDDEEAWLTEMLEGVPLGRAGRPEEIARASLYLATSDSSYVTGQVLVLDGGATI